MIIPAGFCQANLRYSGTPVPFGAEVTLGFDTGLFAGDPVDVATSVMGNLESAGYAGFLADDAFVFDILVKFGPNSTGPSATGGTPLPGTGGVASSPGVAMLMRKNTALGGRKGRGRSYWPAIPESQFGSDGSVGSTVVGDWEDMLNDFFTKMGADDLHHVLLHGDATTPSPVTSITVDSRIGTQRRRVRG